MSTPTKFHLHNGDGTTHSCGREQSDVSILPILDRILHISPLASLANVSALQSTVSSGQVIQWSRMLSEWCSSARNSTDTSSLHPSSAESGVSQEQHLMSPSDMVGPSPVTSNGTETTDIEDEEADDVQQTSPEVPKKSGPFDSQETVRISRVGWSNIKY